MVCICRPATERDIPANTAVMARGNLKSHRMICHSACPDSLLKMILSRSPMAIRTEPINISAKKHTRKSMENPVKRRVFLDKDLAMLSQVLYQLYEFAQV
jgi:hypothetical protein